jgi:hypothetical protein
MQKAEFDVRYLEVVGRKPHKDMQFVFRIQNSTDPRDGLDVGCETEEEMRAWGNAITAAAKAKTDA